MIKLIEKFVGAGEAAGKPCAIYAVGNEFYVYADGILRSVAPSIGAAYELAARY